MAHCEVDSFVTKFKHLWHAGTKASLTIEAVDGQASVKLRAGLGYLPPPVHPLGPHGPHGQPFRQHRGPAYQRRQERRKAAGKAADHCVSNDIAAAQADDTSENAAETAESSETTKDKNNTAELAQNDFSCNICDFKSNWANGLQIHMTKMHANIEQVDGNGTVLEEEDEKYSETEHYWKNGKLGTIYQTYLDVNYLIERSNLPEDSKMNEKEKALDARKFAFGSNFQNVPPWNKKW